MTDLVHKVNSTVLQEVDILIGKLQGAEACLEHGYARLGLLLTEVSEKEFWHDVDGCKSMNDYIRLLGEKYNRGRTQIYNYFATVKELRPYVTEQQLDDMGISKARELKSATKRSGFPPSQEIISEAVKPETTIEKVRELLFNSGNPAPENKGTWFDLAGFPVTPEELATINDAFEAACKTDPIISQSLPAWARKKEWILRMAMEYLGSHGEAANRGEA